MSANLSILSLVVQADIVVKLILILLLFMSVFSWTVIFRKIYLIKTQLREINHFEKLFWAGADIQVIRNAINTNQDSYIREILSIGMKRFSSLENTTDANNIKKQMKFAMNSELSKVNSSIEQSTHSLATIGSSSPFIGLFGTVWGIMHSFQTIGLAKTATLAIVAPSIAEALLATAAGLFVAIPAVVFYNYIVDISDNFNSRVEGLITQFTELTSSEL